MLNKISLPEFPLTELEKPIIKPVKLKKKFFFENKKFLCINFDHQVNKHKLVKP